MFEDIKEKSKGLLYEMAISLLHTEARKCAVKAEKDPASPKAAELRGKAQNFLSAAVALAVESERASRRGLRIVK